jgi:hypothetical protein
MVIHGIRNHRGFMNGDFLERARRGGQNSRKYLDPKRRTELARKAAKARWSAGKAFRKAAA